MMVREAISLSSLLSSSNCALKSQPPFSFSFIHLPQVVRSSLPKMTLDKSYTSKAEVANDVKEQLASIMAEFGYEIIAALVTDLEPDAKVKEAMNEINAAQRMREAALEKAEADKILVVKAAVSPSPTILFIDIVRAHFVLC